jgi:hypothetical protein
MNNSFNTNGIILNPKKDDSDLAPFSTSHFLDEKARLEARETAQNPVTDIGARSEMM